MLLDSTFITFVVNWTYGLWRWFLFLFLKGNMLSKQLHKLNNALMFFSALVTTAPEGLLAKQIRIHEIWICCPVFCTYIEIECVLLILSCYDVSCLISHMVRGGVAPRCTAGGLRSPRETSLWSLWIKTSKYFFFH